MDKKDVASEIGIRVLFPIFIIFKDLHAIALYIVVLPNPDRSWNSFILRASFSFIFIQHSFRDGCTDHRHLLGVDLGAPRSLWGDNQSSAIKSNI